MLVLAAAFNTPYLRTLVDKERFQRLLGRTITFLRKLSPISPTCYNDCGILEGISRLLFPTTTADAKGLYRNELEPRSATASFGHST